MEFDPNDPVEELMIACLEHPPEEWDEALRRAAGEHPELAAELLARAGLVTGLGAGHPSGVAWGAAGAGPGFQLPWRVGEFTCTEHLGSGGMGIVFRARQPSLDRDVALKVVRPERLLLEGSLARFRREVEALAAERDAREQAVAMNAELEEVLAFTVGLFERAAPNEPGGAVPDAREMLQLGAKDVAQRLDSGRASTTRIHATLGRLFTLLTDAEAALPHLETALARYAVDPALRGTDRHAELLRLAGHDYGQLLQLDRADELLHAAYEMACAVHGDQSAALHPFLATLADFEAARGERTAALAWRQRAVDLAVAGDIAEEDARLVRLCGLVAVSQHELGELDAARSGLELRGSTRNEGSRASWVTLPVDLGWFELSAS